MTDAEYMGLELHVGKFYPDAFRHRGIDWPQEKRQALFGRFREAELADAKHAVDQEFRMHPDEDQPNWNRVIASLPQRKGGVDVVKQWQAEIDREKARFRDRWGRLDAKGKAEARGLATAMLPERLRPTVRQDPHRDSRWRAFCSSAMDVMDGAYVPMSSTERFAQRLVVMHRTHETRLQGMEQRLGRRFPYLEPIRQAEMVLEAPEGVPDEIVQPAQSCAVLDPSTTPMARTAFSGAKTAITPVFDHENAVDNPMAPAVVEPPSIDFDLEELERMAEADRRRERLVEQYPAAKAWEPPKLDPADEVPF